MFQFTARISTIAALLVVAACDNNPNPRPLHEKDADGTPWDVRYGVLSEDPKSFDPQCAYDQMSRRVIEPVYDTLLQYHPMKTHPYEVEPCMLQEVPKLETAPDGRQSYLCTLKEGIFFHDDPCFPNGKGRELVAEDVQYVFQRICDPRVESPFYATYADFIEGMTEAKAMTHDGSVSYDYDRWKVSGIEVLDRRRFLIKLRKPYPQILYWLAFQSTAPVAREAVEYYDGKEHNGELRGDFRKFQMVGTGPFRLADYTPRRRVRLEKVPGYKTTVFPSDGFPAERVKRLEKLANKPLPLVDEVIMTIIREPIPIFILMRQGYLDGMAANKDSFATLISPEKSLAPKYRDRGMTLSKDSELSTFWISLNMADPLIGKNKKLRQALASAYDAKTYSEIFFNGVAPVATQLLPPGIFGYEKERVNPYAFDLERAKRLLAEAGYPNGIGADGRQLEITLDSVVSGSEDRQRAEFDQRQFERLGIKVKISENTFARLTKRLDDGDFQICSGSGWGADYPDAENFYFLFYSKNMPLVGKNSSRYDNPEFDRIFERMATMENTPERFELIKKMNAIVAEDCPIILTFNKQYYSVVQPWAPRTQDNFLLEGGFKYAVTDTALRERLQREWNRKTMWPIGVFAAALVLLIAYAVRWNRRRNA